MRPDVLKAALTFSERAWDDDLVTDDGRSTSASPAGDATTRVEREVGRDVVHRLSAVQRLLNQAMARGSDRDVVSAFAEALAVCEDVEVRGYVETIEGRFELAVTLAGSDPSTAPLTIRLDALPEDAAFVRLTTVEIERLQFPAGETVWVSRIGGATSSSWLVVFSGAVAPPDEVRLMVYVDLLDQALRAVTVQAGARASWALLEHLLPAGDRVEPAAQAALSALSDAVGAAGAALVVTMVTGMHVLSLGNADVFSVPRQYGGADEIVSTSRILDRYSMTLAVRRLDGRAFTRAEQHRIDVATPIFAMWLTGVLQQPAYQKDRRIAPRRFDEIVERLAARALEDGSLVSIVLFRLNEGAVRAPAIRRWVSAIRGQLRPGDLAGLVSENEVVVLLTDTAPEHVVSVVERLRRPLDTSEQFAGLAPLAIGIASANAAEPFIGSGLTAARSHAARSASA